MINQSPNIMKPTHIFLIVYLLSTTAAWSMNLKDAIASKLVAVEISGSDWDKMPASLRNSAFAPKMQMTVSNLSSAPLEMELDPGYMLEPTETSYQAMLLTQPISMKLKSKERKTDFVYAMCTQLSHSGPNSSLQYHIGGLAKPSLLQMALFIVNKKYLVHAAQEAVWSISDDMPITSIGDGNPGITDDLQKQAATIKHVDLEKLKKEYKANKGAAIAEFNGPKIDRNIPITVKDSAMVSVGYYTINDSLIKPIMQPTMLMGGKHSVRYDPFPVAFAGKSYTVKMMKDGSPYKEYFFRQ